ncbi:MAG: Cysteine desulfurase [uncultured Sphingomonas sp.]|uniref:Cysteine desulfurase n=1 Tax=uncultured Sphingomonas sp. TaxID=158754 RepID=A0A6J4SUK9_9SPHN|nr:MAG: Cysteine desulfurase [uncultured Sphingomonas sp.]
MSAAHRLYLDHAATTLVLHEARTAMLDACDYWANPSSPHADGRAARAALERSRGAVANALGYPHDVILTSGATEAIRLAARGAKVPGRMLGATEHEVVPAAMGRAKVIGVLPDGTLNLDALDEALAGDPAVVAVQHVNNETGVIQPLPAIRERVTAAGSRLLVDCAQSAGKLPLPDADFIAISGHKFGAPPGVGALLVKELGTLRASGGQERGYRRGTENLPAATAMAAALATRAFASALPAITQLRSKLEQVLVTEGATVIGHNADRSPFIGGYAMPGVASASQLVQFDLAGIAISAGSACSSGSMKPSKVLAAMGIPADTASCVIRVSFGPSTTEANVERFLSEWRRIRSRAEARAA